LYKPQPASDWPESWQLSFSYDRMEVFDCKINLAYFNSYKNRSKCLLSQIERLLPSGSTIIDLAAGSGNFTLLLAEMGYRTIWNDLRSDLVPYVQAKYEKGEVLYEPGNIFELNLDPVDGVIIAEIIEHVAHPDLFLRKVASLVKPGGYVFLTTPTGDYFLNRLPRFSSFSNPEKFEKDQFKPNADGHIFLLFLDEFYSLASKASLSVFDIQFNNNPLSSGHLKLSYLLKYLPNNMVNGIEKFTRKLPKFISRKIHSNVMVVLKRNSR